MLVIVSMINVKFKQKQRKIAVMVYKCILGLEIVILFLGMFFIFMYILVLLYALLYCLYKISLKNLYVAQYLSMSTILVLSSPIVYSSLKYIKKSLYKKYSYNYVLRGTMVSMVKEVTIKYFDALPIKGLLHILNLILIISANIAKLRSIDIQISINVVYMSIGTYYATDKVNDYFKKKYNNIFCWIDNKLFMTSKIDDAIKININDFTHIINKLFDNYIETGKYEINNNDKDKVDELFK